MYIEGAFLYTDNQRSIAIFVEDVEVGSVFGKRSKEKELVLFNSLQDWVCVFVVGDVRISLSSQ